MIKLIDIFSTCKFFFDSFSFVLSFLDRIVQFFRHTNQNSIRILFRHNVKNTWRKQGIEGSILGDKSWGINPNRNFRMFVGSDNVNLFVFVE